TVNHPSASIYGRLCRHLTARIISSMWRWSLPQQPPNTFGFRFVRGRQRRALGKNQFALCDTTLPVLTHYLAGIITSKSSQVRRPSEKSFHPAVANDRDISS